jgi:hypothetical protein
MTLQRVLAREVVDLFGFYTAWTRFGLSRYRKAVGQFS